MPKIKTSKSASKRIVKITKNGKVIRLKMASQHLARKKSKRARRNALGQTGVSVSDIRKIKRLIPYGN